MNEKITMVRDRLGLSQEELEVRAGLPRNRVAKWESGQGEPHARHLTGLCRALGVPIAWLCDPEAPENPPPEEPRGVVLSDLDLAVLEVARRIGHSEVLTRLAERGGAEPSGYARWISPNRDETEADIRRESERKARGQNKRAKPKGSPRGAR